MNSVLAILIGLMSGAAMSVAVSSVWCVLHLPARIQHLLHAASPRMMGLALLSGLMLAALLILLLGSALGLTWFHADVNMPQAQADVYAAITGAPPDDVRLITIPYCVGVALGVCVFYAIPFPHQTTPLEVKLTEYQEDMEKAEGKPIE